MFKDSIVLLFMYGTVCNMSWNHASCVDAMSEVAWTTFFVQLKNI